MRFNGWLDGKSFKKGFAAGIFFFALNGEFPPAMFDYRGVPPKIDRMCVYVVGLWLDTTGYITPSHMWRGQELDTGLYTHLYGFPFFDGWPSHLFHFLTMARMIWALNWSYPHWFPSYLLESRVPMIKQKRIGRVSKWPVNVWWTYEPSDGKWLFFGSFPAGNILEDLACLAARTHCRCLQYALVARL